MARFTTNLTVTTPNETVSAVKAGDYDVALSKAKIAHFINKKVQVQYWIALEADSTF